jgi:hypothetical protein
VFQIGYSTSTKIFGFYSISIYFLALETGFGVSFKFFSADEWDPPGSDSVAVLLLAGLGGGICRVYDPNQQPPTVQTAPGPNAALHRHLKPIRAAERHHGIATPRRLDPSSQRWPTPELRATPTPHHCVVLTGPLVHLDEH